MDAVIFIFVVSLIVVIIVALLPSPKKVRKGNKPIVSGFKDKENHSLKDALKYLEFVPYSGEDKNVE